MLNNQNQEWLADMSVQLRRELNDLYARLDKESSDDPSPCGDADIQQRIARILRAFERIETGEYEACDVCGAVIARERLELDPAVHTCTRCAPAPHPEA